ALVVFWLALIHGQRPELIKLNRGVMLPGGDRPRNRRALLVYYSLTGNGRAAIDQVRSGLREAGYRCRDCVVVPTERERYTFPFRSLGHLVRTLVEALLRRSAQVELHIDPPAAELDSSADPQLDSRDSAGDHDLVVCLSQTWMLGISAPIQGLFEHPDGPALFAGRDVAVVNVCRGLWRRSQAQLTAAVAASGGRVIATSPHSNPGREPMRLFSLFAFLALGPQRWPHRLEGRFLTPQRLAEPDRARLRQLGHQLAGRPRPGQAEPSADSDSTCAGDSASDTDSAADGAREDMT
ncbi:MAG: hypothetical protein AAGC55_19600, partial [Myxococcota bacterium]